VATLTLNPTIDARINGILTTSNYGSQSLLTHGVNYSGGNKTETWRSLLNFNVSALAGATINSAKLRRYITDVVGDPFDVKIARCTRPQDWVEGAVTWERYADGQNWTTQGGDFSDTTPAAVTYSEPSTEDAYVETTGLEAFVEDALQFRNGIVSLLLRNANEAPGTTKVSVYRSSEATNKPELVVDYTPPGGEAQVLTLRNYW